MLEIQLLPALSDNYIHLLHDPQSGTTAVVDPAEAGPVLVALAVHGWRLDHVLNTHHHGDHVGANLELKRHTGCQIVGAACDRSRIPGIDIALTHGDTFMLGAEVLQILETPGHTLGHIVYHAPDSQALFCGDTLFSLGCGRLFEGTAAQLYQSLQHIKALPPQTRIYCAHEYTAANGRFALSVEADNRDLQQRLMEVAALRRAGLPSLPSTLAQELASNPFLREHSPSIRTHLQMQDHEPVEVFAKLRALKDNFV